MLRATALFVCLLGLLTASFGQKVSVSIGSKNIGINQALRITVQSENQNIKNSPSFPAIAGFDKGGTSSSTNMQFINGRSSSSHSITMSYIPKKQGTFKIPPFKIKVNGKDASFPGATVKVGPEKQQQRRQSPFGFDPFGSSPFGNRQPAKEYAFKDIKDNAFLGLVTDKNEVFIGEPVQATLAFFTTPQDDRILRFKNNLGEQVSKMSKTLTPKNGWEENFPITEVKREKVKINGKDYFKYPLLKSVFYPINNEDLVFNSAKLDMIKFKVSEQTDFFGNRRTSRDSKTFYSSKKTVKVKPLPEHPLKDEVPVGRYRLNETISNNTGETNSPIDLTYEIIGEGNIASMNNPTVKRDNNLTFYPPQTVQNIQRQNGRVTGKKGHSFIVIPQEPGEYNISDYLEFIYFDFGKGVYDTLQSEIKLSITGESQRNASIAANDLGPFYNDLEADSNDVIDLESRDMLRTTVQASLGLMLLVMIGLAIRKKKRDGQ